MKCRTEDPWQKYREKLLQKLEINPDRRLGKMLLNKEKNKNKERLTGRDPQGGRHRESRQ